MKRQDDNIWEGTVVNQPEATPVSTGVRKSPVDINFRRVFSVWPYVLICGMLGLAAGMLYMRYVSVVYTASTSISIDEQNEMSLGQALTGSQRDPFNDRVAFLKSPTLARLLVDTLGLQYHAVAQGRIKDKDFYGTIRWSFMDFPADVPDMGFTLYPNRSGFNFVSGKTKGRGKWGEPLNINGRKILVNSSGSVAAETPIACYSVNTLSAAFDISNRLQVSAGKENKVVNLGFSDVSPERAKDILKGIVHIYNSLMEQEKKQSYLQAIDFIDGRIIPLGEELDSIETSLAHYKSSKGFVGNSANGSLYLNKVQEGQDQMTNIKYLKSTITEVEKFLSNPDIPEGSMVLMGVNDGVLQSSVSSFQQARRERDRLALTQTPNNPSLILAEKNLKEQRANLDIQLQNYKDQLANTESNYNSTLQQADSLLRSTPMEEKELLDKQRMMTIKENLFLSLLQKKEEAAISKASVTVNTKILYPPVILNSNQNPSKSKVLSIAVLLGLILPFIYAILREVLNNQIVSKKQLQAITSAPVIAEIEQTEQELGARFVIGKNKRSMFGEQIRALRTSLDFYKGLNKPVSYLLFTSSVSGEGKTFMSINLAKSYALQGKRVALLEFDLRRPKISKQFSVPAEHPGMTNFLVGKCKPEDCRFSLAEDDSEKFDLFVSGPIPPNPQELIFGERMDVLKAYLDKHYDVVIIDTPPYGMVADARILGKWADVTLVLVRYMQTVFDQVQEINDWYESGAFPSMSLVLNGVKKTGYFGNKYGYYYYRRKYGYGYYSYGEGKRGY